MPHFKDNDELIIEESENQFTEEQIAGIYFSSVFQYCISKTFIFSLQLLCQLRRKSTVMPCPVSYINLFRGCLTLWKELFGVREFLFLVKNF